MHICIVSQQLKNVYSGIGLHATNLITALAKENHSVTILVPESQKINIASPQKLFTVKDVKTIQSQARWIIYSLRFSNALKLLEQNNSFDVVHFTDVRDSFFCKQKSKWVGNINDTYSSEVKSLRFYKQNYFDYFKRWAYYHLVHQIEKRKLPTINGIITNSTFTQANISKTYQIPHSKLFLCYKSVDYARYSEIAKKNLEKNEKPFDHQILFVGGNMQRKGILDLIKAISLLRTTFPTIKVNVAGKDKLIPKYKEICQSSGVASNFHFLGWVSQNDLLHLYEKASMFVMPSITEAFGVVFLEAMSAGVPVIGTKVGGIPEIINHKENGLLVPKNSPSDLANAIRLVFDNQGLSHSMSIKGLNTAKTFSVENMMKCTYEIYKSIV